VVAEAHELTQQEPVHDRVDDEQRRARGLAAAPLRVLERLEEIDLAEEEPREPEGVGGTGITDGEERLTFLRGEIG